MAITDDLRKSLTDPKPLYFAAGAADLVVEQAKKVPELIEQLRVEAPSRIEAVRNSDPKAVQDRVAGQAKEAQATVQAKFNEVIGVLDTDLKKLGETAQHVALRGVGVAAEYAVKARETYEKVAERGEQTVRSWRGEAADEITEIAVAVEPETSAKPEPAKPEAVKTEPVKTEPATGAAKPATAKKPAARKSTAKKSTPPSSAT
ncbi:hypothetical protein [Streptomyces sp. NRRL F-5135]|uniref:hypothetical protein n=1 Tax=Streptomyces sp. NRRL F-5135 TaxID=1463858 RepID=UPI0004C54B42|nr:hypothetical protein [Streptomyces sp. NRRL F-5135]